jgi:hypothetical protein
MMTRDPVRFLIVLVSSVLALAAFARAQVTVFATITDPNFTGPYPSSTTLISNAAQPQFSANGWNFGVANGPSTTQNTGTQQWSAPGSITMITNSGSTNGSAYLNTVVSGLVAGATYTVTFTGHRQGAIGDVGIFVGGTTAGTGGTRVGNFILGTSNTVQSATFVATGTSEVLQFQDTNPGTGTSNWTIGSISVAQIQGIPETNPVVAGALLVIGIGLVEARRIRKRKLR